MVPTVVEWSNFDFEESLLLQQGLSNLLSGWPDRFAELQNDSDESLPGASGWGRQ